MRRYLLNNFFFLVYYLYLNSQENYIIRGFVDVGRYRSGRQLLEGSFRTICGLK